MYTLSQLLQYKYPTLVVGVDYVLHNDGNGDYISTWNSTSITQPTSAQLTALQTDNVVVAAATAAQKAAVNAPILAQLAAIDLKSIRSCRENDTAMMTQYENQAAALRAQLQ